MNTRKTSLLPTADKTLRTIGENIRLARKRRRLTEIQVSERAGIARSTLQLIERGEAGVAMAVLSAGIVCAGLDKDLVEGCSR